MAINGNQNPVRMALPRELVHGFIEYLCDRRMKIPNHFSYLTSVKPGNGDQIACRK